MLICVANTHTNKCAHTSNVSISTCTSFLST